MRTRTPHKDSGKWSDVQCIISDRLAICEKPQPATWCAAADGWSPFGQCCYRLQTALQSFYTHSTECQTAGGQLVSIRSAAENNFVQQLQQSGCSGSSCAAYIGLSRNVLRRFSSWLDGSKFGGSFYANWNSGEPDNVGGSENCAEIVQGTGKWNDISCNPPRIAVCKNCQSPTTTTSTTTSTPSLTRCGAGWSLFGECCYSILAELKTFDGHRVDCETQNGQLVSITSLGENNLVMQLLYSSCPGSTCTGFIGLRRSAGQFTSWLDSKPLGAYTNWNTGEPNNAGGDEDCAEIMQSTGKWNDINCDSTRIAVCKRSCQPS